MKGKRTDLGDNPCAVARSLDVVGEWWSLLIVREAFQGVQRFGEFQKNIGLAKNILSSRLKKLVEEGIFTVDSDEQAASVPRYVLTDRGKALCVVLVALSQWGGAYCFSKGEQKFEVLDKLNRQPLQRLELRAADGRLLGPDDLQLSFVQPKQAS